ncbi:MAG: xanthine dehydrogenase family protein molybdopterin-binding subunit [Janthinobacterium lividum]
MDTSLTPTAPNIKPGKAVGMPLDRVDGRLKVTGGAKYSGDMPVADVVYAALIMSTVARGTITGVDTRAAEAQPGVIKVITPANAMRLPNQPGSPGAKAPRPQERVLQVLQDPKVLYQNQPIGVVVADTFERAAHAASLVKFQYDTKAPRTEMDKEKRSAYKPEKANQDETDSKRGDVNSGMSQAATKISETYVTPVENHNPMEPHATLSMWEGNKLTVYDTTQGIFGTRKVLAKTFALPDDNVRIVSHFLGGGFGCKGSAWSHVVISALAAKQVGRPVKLVLERTQMFGPVGYRPRTEQDIRLGAAQGGALTGVVHDVHTQTSSFDEFVEASASVTRILYDTPNEETSHRVIRLDVGTPTYMRGPGESTGTFAIESAMDELAYALDMDPIALRLKNYAEKDPESGKPWSSKSLRECYRVAAEQFGWDKRTPAPGSMKTADGKLRGWGMATATYPTRRSKSSAMARLLPDGSAYVQAGSQDLGTGTYTVMTQTAADALGLTPESVLFELGDTTMPETPVSGGSQTAASTGSAVQAASKAAKAKAIGLAVADPASPLSGLSADDIDVKDGTMSSKTDPTKSETYTALIARQKLPNIEAKTDSAPGPEKDEYEMHSFGAVFAEVEVDPDFGEVRVKRVVGAYGAGNILNAKTARSQLIGGIVFGIGMALLEETVLDTRIGRVMNADLAEYHVPVNADVPEIDITFVPETDPHVNPLGVKGIGEIGITGVVAAIANAVYHASGQRVRDLPLRLDKVMRTV